MSKKRKGSVGVTIGGVIVGFDQQIFRTLPPAHELVVKGAPVRGLSGQDPHLEVVFPDDLGESLTGSGPPDEPKTDAPQEVRPEA